MKLMSPGQEYFKIDPEDLAKVNNLPESERIQFFENKFEQWIKIIEGFINDDNDTKPEAQDAGPKTEL
jgi:hypothetical protein